MYGPDFPTCCCSNGDETKGMDGYKGVLKAVSFFPKRETYVCRK